MHLIKDNRYFFFSFLLLTYIGATLLFFTKKGDLIFFFSDHRTAFGDFFFTYFTKMGEEIMYLVVTLSLLYFIKPRNYLYLVYIGGIAATVALLSYSLKAYFRHARPGLYFDRNGLLDEIVKVSDVALHGGLSSFPSGHTMSGFALYAFVAFVIPKKKWMGVFLFFVALFVGISRMYLVQHFLQDVFLGGILGVGVGMLWWWIHELVEQKQAK